MTAIIHQEEKFAVEPDALYEALLSSKSFSGFTGAAAEIDAKEGGAFSCFDGQITGRNIELLSGKRIVQAWRVAAWEPGVYSIVRFELKKSGRETSLILDHAGYPESFDADLKSGWPKMYWQPLRAFLATSS